MNNRRALTLLVTVFLAFSAAHLSYGLEYTSFQEEQGLVPPEPFADDLDLGIESPSEEEAVEDASVLGIETTGGLGCPPIENLLSEIIPVGEMSASIKSSANRPADCAEGLFLPPQPGIARSANVTQFYWQASNFFHRPLYFDDTPLERYGQTRHPLLQPVISGGRFFGTFFVLPYKMGIDRTGDCVTTLGYYRPGSCAPCIRERLIPAFEADAALLEAGTALALIFILP